jgi:hypothetical protein
LDKRWYACYITWSSISLVQSSLQVIGRRPGEENLVLACIDLNSDSYPLIIVRREQIVQLQALAQIAGYGKIVEVEALS